MLPYTIPYLGSVFRMKDPHSMYEWALKNSKNQFPVALRLGPMKVYLLFGAKNVGFIFKNSKTLSKDLTNEMVVKATGLTGGDRDIMLSDKSGLNIMPSVQISTESRIWKQLHDLNHPYLSAGKAVTKLTALFEKYFIAQCNEEPLDQWTSMPLYDMMKTKMFIAATTALTGSEIINQNSGLTKTYWDYDDVFLPMLTGIPRLLSPAMYRARDKMLIALQKWIKFAHLNYKGGDKDWEPSFGSRYTRETIFTAAKGGLSQSGQAALMMSLVWAAHSNSIPAATWILLEALQRPSILAKLRTEIGTVITIDPEGNLAIEFPKLVTLPLLSSMYLEVLRLRSSMTIVRQIKADMECDGFILKSGSLIMSPSWVAHRSENLWSSPNAPAHEFCPERFMESLQTNATKPENFFPYGGGSVICAGRFFAKQEIMAAVAIFVFKFEIEIIEWVDLKTGEKSSRAAKELCDGYAGGGIVPPDRDMMIRMKRVH